MPVPADTTAERQNISRDVRQGHDAHTDRRYARWRWRIFGVTWLAYAGFYLTRKSFSSAKILMGEGSDVNLSRTEMTGIDTSYSVAYAVGQFIFGVAGDRRGPRLVVLTGLVGSIVVATAMGSSSTAVILGGLFFLQGLCQASGWAPLSKNVSQFYSRGERGSVMGIWCTNYAAGGFLATIIAAKAAADFGWRAAFYIPALLLVVITAIFYLLQRNRPEDVGLPSIARFHGEPEEVGDCVSRIGSDGMPSLIDVLQVALSPMVLLLCFTYFLLKPARYLLLFWGPTYIHDVLGADVGKSGVVASAFELGGPLGAVAAGIISDRWFGARRIPIAVISLLALGGMFCYLDDLPKTALAYGAALFCIGICMYAADSLLAGTAAIDFGTKESAATAAGLVNGAGSIGQIIGPAIPVLVPQTWGWHEMFCLLSGMAVIAAAMLAPKWNAVPASTGSS